MVQPSTSREPAAHADIYIDPDLWPKLDPTRFRQFIITIGAAYSILVAGVDTSGFDDPQFFLQCGACNHCYITWTLQGNPVCENCQTLAVA